MCYQLHQSRVGIGTAAQYFVVLLVVSPHSVGDCAHSKEYSKHFSWAVDYLWKPPPATNMELLDTQVD